MLLKNPTIVLAAANLRNIAMEKLYLRTGIDLTRPIQIYGLVNMRCNGRCKMCICWREKNPPELPAPVWIGFLRGLKEFSGAFNVNFSGGEPLVKRDLFDILEYCRDEGMIAGIATNGLLLKGDNVRKLIDCNLYNINVSIDSMDDEIQDQIRGVPGLLAKVRKNMEELVGYKKRSGSSVRIIVKPVACAETLAGLYKIVEYAKDMGIEGVNFQPIFEWSEESKEMSKVDPVLLNEVVHRLIDMKKSGYPILNSEGSILQWPDYFAGTLAGRTGPCVAVLRSLSIAQDGTVRLCGFCNADIGNIANEHIRTMWYSERARRLKASLVRCERACLAACVVKRSLKDYVVLFRRLVR